MWEWIAGSAAAAAGLLGWMSKEAYGYRLRREEVCSPRIPDAFNGYKILYMTDIHRRQLSERKLRAWLEEADCVFLGGDITERGVPWERLRSNMQLLRKYAPVYAVLGNHDLKAGKEQVRQILRETGVVLLSDKSVELVKGAHRIVLSGIQQPASKYHPYTRYRGRNREGRYHIVLVHDPRWVKDRTDYPYDLVLAGHTHGGQIVLPLAGAVKLEKFYQSYKAGWYDLPGKEDGATAGPPFLISKGFGTSHLPLRLGCPAELHLITLKQKP
ncbi:MULTISPECIES: metallophosphoesterase [Paenibacillus]|uniref:Metallophosphoesterase n=1 Tax=Paenibacillus campinasensis TaxID=66347 RepID=A0A268F2V1_9BACL|nr:MULTISPECIES: metallophosphoesterase [Paenibacillus]MUG64973.1 metallophosphoesterase [Paenibacillus campinasensis]PAD79691.1 metallophosphoesterase [Paenibacillus campinasensis]PAK53554.1 metallophosphoesterase [Paenibacillus sp. 7541]